jgi:hypothetical protein
VEVWLCEDGRRQSLTGTVNTALANDAMRHGQDLVDELIDRTLKEADRRLAAA